MSKFGVLTNLSTANTIAVVITDTGLLVYYMIGLVKSFGLPRDTSLDLMVELVKSAVNLKV